jgi:hypothetical protein
MLARGVHLPADGALVGGHHRRPPAAAPARPRRRQARPGALVDQVALELRQGREDVEHEPPTGRGGVNVLLQRAEADAALGQPS